MINPITYYDARRKKRHHQHVAGAEREDNGRVSRSAGKPEFMVYFVKVGDSPLIKVGRTQNINTRIASYEGASGQVARCVARLHVADGDAALALENHSIALMKQRYKQRRREWFIVPRDDVRTVLEEIVASSPVAITRRDGAHIGDADVRAPEFFAAGASASAVAVQYHRTRI